MRISALAVFLALAGSGRLTAQDRTAEQVNQARALYERLEIERALPLLRQVISPQWQFPVTAAQRVEAYVYLGAAFTLTGRSDSGVVYFRAALERDPFVELSGERFTPAQLQAFARARRETFALAARPVGAARIDPRTERIRFTLATTHGASVRAAVIPAGGTTGVVLFEAATEGVREITWDGLGADGRLAAPGRYELRVDARSRLTQRRDSAQVYFDLGHDVPPLEDTLPALAPAALLPERSGIPSATADLAKGLGVIAGALLISGVLANGDLQDAGGPATVVAVAGAVTGLAAFVVRLASPEIPANVAANRRRLEERQEANDAIRARNAERLAQTVLVITPAAGVGP